MTYVPPPDDRTPWGWIGEDALEAGIYAVTLHLITQKTDGTWVAWFQRREKSNRKLYTPVYDELIDKGWDAYLVTYWDDGKPVKIINLKTQRSSLVDHESLQLFMKLNGCVK